MAREGAIGRLGDWNDLRSVAQSDGQHRVVAFRVAVVVDGDAGAGHTCRSRIISMN